MRTGSVLMTLVLTAACGNAEHRDERASPQVTEIDAQVSVAPDDALARALDRPSLALADVTGASEPPSANTALSTERDRLLDTLPQGRCAAWGALDADQRAMFLLTTDLLGKRSVLSDSTTALAHVVTIHAIRGREQEDCVRCCGNREFNRAYLSIDGALAAQWRTEQVPAWRDSLDPAGPHDPFTHSSETHDGPPRGQLHMFDDDADAVPLGRPGVEQILDPRAVELDLDFNLLHESSPLCSYAGETGVERYVQAWSDAGLPGDPELGYTPTDC